MKNWKLWAKRILVLTLSTAMTVSAVDIPVVAAAMEVSGSDDVHREMRITEFAPLEASVREQVLTIGASEEDIQFPDALTVTIEQKVSVQEEETEDPEKEQEKEERKDRTEDLEKEQEKEEQEGQTEEPEKEQEKEEQKDQTEEPEKEQEKEEQEEQTEEPEKEQEKEEQEDQTEDPEKEQEKEEQEDRTEDLEKENAGAEGTSGGQENNRQEEQQSAQQEAQDGSNAVLTASVKSSWLEKAADVLFPPMEVYAADWTAEANEDIEEAQQQTEVSVTQEEDTLEGITWKLNIEESDAEVFDSSEQSAGLCYVYTPVLPETDADGNALTVADDVELPQIYVLIEGHKVQTLSSSEVINIADVKPTNSNGQIVINAENVADWNNKILTGSVTSTDLQDSAKGLVIDGGTEGITLKLTIRDLTIDRKKFMGNGISAIELRNHATLDLTLEGNNYLYGAYGGAGIGVPSGTALRITEESIGSLDAKGGNGYGGAAGIGAISPGWNLDSSSSMPKERTCGYIEIAGGNVKAEGGTYRFRGSDLCGAAGIGGSYEASGGQINITGGSVTATGGMYAAGIGGGTNGNVARITISGGTVVAVGTGKGMRQPAAIGRGIDTTGKEGVELLTCGAIDLNGGNVTAKGNIGYGYVESDGYPIWGDNAKVTVSDKVFLTLDGEIQDGSLSATVKNYELNFTVFDTAFTTGQGQMTAKVEWGNSLIEENVAAKVTTPGQAAFTLSFAHNAFSGMQEFNVTIGEKNYKAEADFSEGKTEYDLTAGKELYPVSLEFYDSAITKDITGVSISVIQDSSSLADADYVHPDNITRVKDGIGKMMIFLPADETGTTEITVKASGINGSKSMTQSKVKVGKTGINTVAMCIGKVTLSAKTSKVNATDVTLAVESNVMTWDLYIKESTQEITDSQEIINSGIRYNQTAQKGEVHLENLTANSNYGYYLVAKQGDLFSEIVDIHFNTPNGARVFWENDSSIEEKYYRDGFFYAIADAENISRDDFTIQAMGIGNYSGYLTLKKSCKLDLNGQNVTMNGIPQCTLALAEKVCAVLMDSVGDGEYHNSTVGGSYSLFNMASDSSLTIQGGNYYDYKELLKKQNETQTGRTLTIEGGSFHGGNHIDIGDGKVVLSGGTFYRGLSVTGICEIKDGYCVKYLSGDKAGTYATELPGTGEDKDIEIVPLPELTGELDLKIGNGISESAKSGTTLTATFTDKSSGNGVYTYRWYHVDGDTETVISTFLKTSSKTSTYMLTDEDIRKRIYCEVTKEGTSGSVKSEMTYSVLGYSIEGAKITLNNDVFEYNGTAQKPKITSVVVGGNKTLTEGENGSYTVSYANNINAGTKAEVIITGRGLYEGTAVKNFTITKKKGDYTIEGVANSYEYTGEEIRPEIVIKDGDTVVPESDYTVSYENNKKPGIATIRITGTENGNYSFENCNKQFQIVHEHDWSYDVSGSVILLRCGKPVCTCKNNRGTLQLSIQNPDALKYNGTTQNVAEVTQHPLEIYPENKIKLEYTGDGLKDGKPKNAGSYTASMSIEEGGRTYTAKNDFEIQKAEPVIVQKPTAAGITWGEALAGSALSGGEAQYAGTVVNGSFAWKDATRKPNVADSNQTAYTVVFTPDDTVNYKPVETTVTLNIKRAGNTPNFPEDHMDVKYVCRKVKDVQLPDGWEWAAADQETGLNVGVQVNATAVYTGEGHGNYETESTVIKITRLECKHTDTKLKDVVAASCGKEGYTGDIVCKDCDILLDTGSPTEALTHDYRESGRKAPTSYAEGEIIYTCIHCKDSYSVKIAKLPDSGNDGEAADGDGGGSSGLPAGTTATPVPTAGGKIQSPAPTSAPASAPVSAPSSRPASTPAPSDNNRETKEPFIKGEDGKEGWQMIESQTDGAKEGETIHVDMNGATTVPGTIFDSIRGRDITVTFDLGGGILWAVNGLDVTTQNAKDIDFGVTMGEQAGRNIPVDVINNVTGERYSMNLTLAYEGEFGFTATLTVNMDAANAGLYANLFYYNPETGELEFMCAGKIDEAGNTELTFNHASDYTIVIDTESMNGAVQDGTETGTEQDGAVDEPDDTGAAPSGQTADEAVDGNSGNVFSNGIFWILIGAAVVIVIAAVGAVCVLRRKKEDQKQ